MGRGEGGRGAAGLSGWGGGNVTGAAWGRAKEAPWGSASLAAAPGTAARLMHAGQRRHRVHASSGGRGGARAGQLHAAPDTPQTVMHELGVGSYKRGTGRHMANSTSARCARASMHVCGRVVRSFATCSAPLPACPAAAAAGRWCTRARRQSCSLQAPRPRCYGAQGCAEGGTPVSQAVR